LDSNQSIGSQDRAIKIAQIAADFESTSEAILLGAKEKASEVYPEIGDLDSQQLGEQVSSIERRINDLRKRIDRKRQVVEMAAANFETTKSEINNALAWVKMKSEWLEVKVCSKIKKKVYFNGPILLFSIKEAP